MITIWMIMMRMRMIMMEQQDWCLDQLESLQISQDDEHDEDRDDDDQDDEDETKNEDEKDGKGQGGRKGQSGGEGRHKEKRRMRTRMMTGMMTMMTRMRRKIMTRMKMTKRQWTRIWKTYVHQIVSDPPECVRHGSKQVQENVEQGIVRVQVKISPTLLYQFLSLWLQTKLASFQVRIHVPHCPHNKNVYNFKFVLLSENQLNFSFIVHLSL